MPTGAPYPNFQISCPREDHAHVDCMRTRGDIPKHRLMCGDVEVLAFLHVWTQVEVKPGKNHPMTFPKPKDVAAYAEAHRDELLALRQIVLQSAQGAAS